MSATLLDAALWYARNRIPVFPCKPRGKEPLTPHGFKDATTDQTVIADWWRQWPDANIGIPTGLTSGLLVVDCDPRNGGPIDRGSFVEQFGPVPETAEVTTGGGGRHFYFRYSGGAVPKTLATGVDLKGDGGYVVAPPSIHPSGERYQVDGIRGARAFLHIAEAPLWLLQRLTKCAGNREEFPRADTKWGAGERNTRLTSRAGTMRRSGFTREVIEAALLEENRRRCDPPLPESEVRQIAASVAQYEPSNHSAALPGVPATIRLSDVVSQDIRWLWRKRVPLGKLTIFDGDPGLGKSLITLDLAARVSIGCEMADGSVSDVDGPAGVLILSAEDGLGDTIRPRLDAAGADCSRILAMTGVKVTSTSPDGSPLEAMRPPCLVDVDELRTAISEVGARLVIIDPLMAFLPAGSNSHRDQDIRAVLAPLAKLAEETGVAIVVVRHLNKARGGNPLYRGGGSIGIIGAVRSGLLAAKDPDDAEGKRRVLATTKANLASEEGSLAYSIVEVGGIAKVEWAGASEHSAARLLAGEATGESDPSALEDAKSFLSEMLLTGEVEANTVLREAKLAGIAERTLRRAKKALGIRAYKNGRHGRWIWTFDDSSKAAKTTEGCQQEGLAAFDSVGILHASEGGEEEIEL